MDTQTKRLGVEYLNPNRIFMRRLLYMYLMTIFKERDISNEEGDYYNLDSIFKNELKSRVEEGIG